MSIDGNFCETCGSWPDEGLEEHKKNIHGDEKAIADRGMELLKAAFGGPRVYIRMVNYPYENTILQMVSTEPEPAFNFVPHNDHVVDTEIRVWQDGEHVETWLWDVNEEKFIRARNL